jgi:predicted GTPase
MPYGDLVAARVQRFATRADLDAAGCTAEEREEYEPHLAAGNLVFAGVDYAAVLRRAETEADLIVWDGGNNDFPFVRPGLHLVLADALRPEQVDTHHPGEAVARMADALVVNKVDAATPTAVAALEERLRAVNPLAPIVLAASPVRLDDPQAVCGRRVLVVEDGPTITHGGMATGAGHVAAVAAGAAEIVDPRRFADGSVAEVYRAYPHIGPVLPAMGYGAAQRAELARCIASSGAEVVVAGTPVDLAAMLGIAVPVVRARYAFEQRGGARLDEIVGRFLDRIRVSPSRS